MKRKSEDLSIDDLWQEMVKESQKSYKLWLQPKSGDLLGDAKYFLERAKAAKERRIRARHGRAALVISVAAIEAITNDGLATIYELFAESWPSEVVDSPPWACFKRISSRPVQRLLKRGKLWDKINYIRRRIDLWVPEEHLWSRLRQVIQARNRVVHMSYLRDPNKYPSVLNDRQVTHTAKIAYETASEYISLLNDGFEEIKLPIVTIRPDWWSEENESVL